ncbi:CGNR zinc finger domain-containing protein [soil metagenome]
MDESARYSGSQEDIEESAAPGQLELVRRFVNTLELENGGYDHLATLDGLSEWLREWDLPNPQLSERDRERAIELREAVRSQLVDEDDGESCKETTRRLNEAVADADLRVVFSEDGSTQLVPACEGFEATLARIAIAIREAMLVGDWDRLKVCGSDDCRWAYYDRSRNHSRNWCRMQECGNRAKVRAFRERRSGI